MSSAFLNPSNETFAIEARAGFNLPARGYDLKVKTEKSDKELIEIVLSWAETCGIEFGGAIERDKDQTVRIHGEFPPNKFSHEMFNAGMLNIFTESLEAFLTNNKVTVQESSNKSYQLTTRLESIIGLDEGYDDSGAQNSFAVAKDFINDRLQVDSASPATIFYNYKDSSQASGFSRGVEPGISVRGTLRESETIESFASEVMERLGQTSLHIVSEGSHLAFKQVKKKTARESATTQPPEEVIETIGIQHKEAALKPYLLLDDLLSRLNELYEDRIPQEVHDAIELIGIGHKNQIREGGGDTLTEHLYPVTNEVMTFARALQWDKKKTTTAILASLLHDYKEDDVLDRISEAEFVKRFGEEVSSLVDILSRLEGEKKSDYFARIAENEITGLIKIADRINNHRCDFELSYRDRDDYRFETALYIIPIARKFKLDLIENALSQTLKPFTRRDTFFSPSNPYVAAVACGGATFEPFNYDRGERIGFWVFAQESTTEEKYGTDDPISTDSRYAVYVPTIAADGQPLDSNIVNGLIEECEKAGLANRSSATGVWEFRGGEKEGTFGQEPIWVCHSNDFIPSEVLRALSLKVQIMGEQEAVAYEFDTRLGLVPYASEDKVNETPPTQTIFGRPREKIDQEVLVIVPANDAEAIVAINYLKQIGAKVIISQQQWGASWNNLSSTELTEIQNWKASNPNGKVIGFEISDVPNEVERIDNVQYQDSGGIQYRSSLQYLSEQLGIKLTQWERLVSLNRAGDPNALMHALDEEGINPKSLAGDNMIRVIRNMNRACQGITPTEEAIAKSEVLAAEGLSKRAVIAHYSSRLWTAHADIFFDQGKTEILLIPVKDGQGNRMLYYGENVDSLVSILSKSGNKDFWFNPPTGNYGGYVGVMNPDETLIKAFEAELRSASQD